MGGGHADGSVVGIALGTWMLVGIVIVDGIPDGIGGNVNPDGSANAPPSGIGAGASPPSGSLIIGLPVVASGCTPVAVAVAPVAVSAAVAVAVPVAAAVPVAVAATPASCAPAPRLHPAATATIAPITPTQVRMRSTIQPLAQSGHAMFVSSFHTPPSQRTALPPSTEHEP